MDVIGLLESPTPERIELLVVEAPMLSLAHLLHRPPGGDHNYVFVRDHRESARHFALRVLHRTRKALRGRRELTKLTCVLDGKPKTAVVRKRLLRALLSVLSRHGVCRLLGQEEESSGVFECVDALSPSLRPGAGLEVRLVGGSGAPERPLLRGHQEHDRGARNQRKR
jgi:hypothetical protein